MNTIIDAWLQECNWENVFKLIFVDESFIVVYGEVSIIFCYSHDETKSTSKYIMQVIVGHRDEVMDGTGKIEDDGSNWTILSFRGPQMTTLNKMLMI